jgi:hypothetical protein
MSEKPRLCAGLHARSHYIVYEAIMGSLFLRACQRAAVGCGLVGCVFRK